METIDACEKIIEEGLKQIPADGLKRVLKRFEDGKPVLLDGKVRSTCNQYG